MNKNIKVQQFDSQEEIQELNSTQSKNTFQITSTIDKPWQTNKIGQFLWSQNGRIFLIVCALIAMFLLGTAFIKVIREGPNPQSNTTNQALNGQPILKEKEKNIKEHAKMGFQQLKEKRMLRHKQRYSQQFLKKDEVQKQLKQFIQEFTEYLQNMQEPKGRNEWQLFIRQVEQEFMRDLENLKEQEKQQVLQTHGDKIQEILENLNKKMQLYSGQQLAQEIQIKQDGNNASGDF